MRYGRLAGDLRRKIGLRKKEAQDEEMLRTIKPLRDRRAATAPLEKEIEKKICDYAKSKGCYVRKFVSPSNRSVPDRIIIAPGGAVGFLEIKRQGCKPTKAQEAEMELLRKVGANTGFCDNVHGGKQFVDNLLQGKQMEEFWG